MPPQTNEAPKPRNIIGLIIANLLFIPTFVFLGMVSLGSFACFFTCGFGGSSYAQNTLTYLFLLFLVGIANAYILIYQKRKAQVGLRTSGLMWLLLILINTGTVYLNWNHIMYQFTGDFIYEQQDFKKSLQAKYENIDCKNVTGVKAEKECLASKSDDVLRNYSDFDDYFAKQNRCSELVNPFNKHACNLIVIKAKNDPYNNMSYCMNLNISEITQEDHTDLHGSLSSYEEITGFSSQIRLSCLTEILFEDKEYYKNVYANFVQGSNDLIYSTSTFPEWLVPGEITRCREITNPILTDICFARTADMFNYREGFKDFCKYIGDSVPKLRENCYEGARAKSAK